MRNFKEGYNFVHDVVTLKKFDHLKEKVKPEGMVFGVLAGGMSNFMTIPQGGITLAMHETAKLVDPNLWKFLVIACLGIINGLSVATETKSLKKAEYSADIVTNLINVKTKNPLKSSLISHGLGFARQAVINPVSVGVAIFNFDYFMESEVSGVVAFSTWSVIANSLILLGLTEATVNGVNKLKNIAKEKAEKVRQNPKVHEVFRRLGRKR